VQISGYSLVHITYREVFVILWDVKGSALVVFYVYFSNCVTYGGGGGSCLGICGPPG
jgi:hypothetical protein